MRNWLALTLSCLALLALVAAGCGGDDEDEGGGGGAGTQEQQTEAAAGKAVEVKLENTQFNPKRVTVAKGTTVKWTNEDPFGHDVTKTGGPGPEFKSGQPGQMTKGASFERTFDTPGTVTYECTVHSGMKGEVVVK